MILAHQIACDGRNISGEHVRFAPRETAYNQKQNLTFEQRSIGEHERHRQEAIMKLQKAVLAGVAIACTMSLGAAGAVAQIDENYAGSNHDYHHGESFHV